MTAVLPFNGEDAFGKFREKKPDLFILDVILSKIDGLSVLEAIKNEGIHGNSKIVVTSATASEFSINKSFDYGADFFSDQAHFFLHLPWAHHGSFAI